MPTDVQSVSVLINEVSEYLGTSVIEVSVPAKTIIFSPGQPCESLVLLRAGSVKVHLIGESGREIILYRVRANDICALSLGCLINNASYNAFGIAENDLEGLAINRRNFDELFVHSKIFRDAVLRSQTTRILDLIGLVEDFAFRPIEERLARLLLTYGGRGAGSTISKTHQDMATDLGTAREVISRTLKRFEVDGLVRLERGLITITDENRLSALQTSKFLSGVPKIE